MQQSSILPVSFSVAPASPVLPQCSLVPLCSSASCSSSSSLLLLLLRLVRPIYRAPTCLIGTLLPSCCCRALPVRLLLLFSSCGSLFAAVLMSFLMYVLPVLFMFLPFLAHVCLYILLLLLYFPMLGPSSHVQCSLTRLKFITVLMTRFIECIWGFQFIGFCC